MTADVAIVGGGPAGAIVATLVANAGRDVVLLERSPAWRWRACGVFASPASVAALRRLGLDEASIARVARPIPAMRVETREGVTFRLTYGGTGALFDSAVGFDRAALDAILLERAQIAGVDVRRGIAVARVDLGPVGGEPPAIQRLVLADGHEPIEARIVVGADGLRSVVARAAGVDRPSPLGSRVGITFHVPDPSWKPHDARMVLMEDGYVGVAPVPGERVNVGIVLGRSWFEQLRLEGASSVSGAIVQSLAAEGEPRLAFDLLDSVAGVSPLGHRVTRRGGEGWVLVGDAAGFLDPFTGEGIHRAIVSAELAAAAIDKALTQGDSRPLFEYDRAMAAGFGTKDRVSRFVQAFLGRPFLFEYAARRLAARTSVRETLGLVIGDLLPASRAIGPGFLGALLRP
jgi:flavin-dependent dehydrogenase